MDQATAITQARYDRIAPFYDAMELFTERSVFGKLRQELWSRISATHIFEVGVGTGKNIPYYPKNSRVTAIDLSERMLERASQKARDLGIELDLFQMDVQKLEFPDNSFDAAVATFVFCSVPVPVQGLRELGRLTRPDGDIWLVEHVRINQPAVIGRIMDLLNPFVVRIWGANINRQTVENVKLAGLQVLEVLPLRGEFVKLIHARPA
jgi:ubiquinone/menaquinone biosynthesis C-methylase UbiE